MLLSVNMSQPEPEPEGFTVEISKPNLRDYGLTGIDSRPRIDVDLAPITDEERAAALEHLIAYQVETHRVVAFRNHLKDYDWQEYEKEKRS